MRGAKDPPLGALKLLSQSSLFADATLTKFIHNSKINTHGCSTVIRGHEWSGKKNLSHPTCTFQAKVKQIDALPSCFSSHAVNKCPLRSPFSASVFALLCFLLVILMFKMASKPSAQVPSSVPKPKKAVMSYGEHTCVLNRLRAGHESLCCCS